MLLQRFQTRDHRFDAGAGLFGRVGFRGMLWSGVIVYAACLVIAAVNTEFLTYWSALVLLGVGWNFLFLSGTNLLPYGYRPVERFRVQSTNDFLVFTVQALASLGSGWLLFHWRWDGIVYACMPLVLVFAILLWLLRKELNPTK